MNKFETNPAMNNSYLSNSTQNKSTVNFKKKERRLREQSVGEVPLSYLDQDITIDLRKSTNNRDYLRPMDRQETEEQISSDIMMNSPVFRKITKRGTLRSEAFMMSLKPTITDDSFGEDFSSKGGAVIRREKDTKVRTILYVKEVDDNENDYLNMELKEYFSLTHDELRKAYYFVIKASVPVFSGAVETLINKIDYKKVMTEEKNNLVEFNIQ